MKRIQNQKKAIFRKKSLNFVFLLIFILSIIAIVYLIIQLIKYLG